MEHRGRLLLLMSCLLRRCSCTCARCWRRGLLLLRGNHGAVCPALFHRMSGARMVRPDHVVPVVPWFMVPPTRLYRCLCLVECWHSRCTSRGSYAGPQASTNARRKPRRSCKPGSCTGDNATTPRSHHTSLCNAALPATHKPPPSEAQPIHACLSRAGSMPPKQRKCKLAYS